MSLKLFHSLNKSGFLIPDADGTSGATVYFFGDSITAGTGSGGSGKWTTQLSTAKSYTENNNGVSGETIAVNSCGGRTVFSTSSIPTKSASLKYIFIAYGVNDYFIDESVISSTDYYNALTVAISYAISTKGWQNKRIIILAPFYTTFDNNGDAGYCYPSPAADEIRKQSFVTAAINAANAYGCNYFDIYNYMKDNGGASLLSDTIHPNDSGHTAIATALNNYII